MIFNGATTAIDISTSSEDEIDYLLDRIYADGYLTPQGEAPSYFQMEDDFYDVYGTTPAYIVCYLDRNNDPTVEACDESSPRSLRLLGQSRKLSAARASMMI